VSRARAIDPWEAAQAQRVLAVHVTRIGDTLLTTPALRAIAAHFPNARLTALGHPKRAEVLENLPYLAKVGRIDKRRALWRGWKDVFTGPEYDWAFVWGEDAALVRYALRKARRVVAARQREPALDARLYAAVEMPQRPTMHAVTWTLALTDAVRIARQGLRLDAASTQDERAAMAMRLRLLGLSGANTRPLIGLQVASFPTKPYRDWPIERFIGLARRVVDEYQDAYFACLGGPGDRARIAPLLAALPGRCKSFAGEFTLRETLAFMHHLDLYVGVDTGPTHLYSALQKPMIVLYHPALPSSHFRPLHHAALWAIDHPLAGQTQDERVPIGEIGVDEVFAAVCEALAAQPSSRPGLPPAG
jgi:heptosyltransferase-3